MRRICVSAGLLALGATISYAQYAPGISPMDTAKPWSLAASVRGFYDDNYLTLPKYTTDSAGNRVKDARDSFGIEVSPSFTYYHSTADTLLSASYVYDLRWYQDRLGTTDQTHQLTAQLEHQFSERYKLALGETFVVAQEPGVLDGGGTVSSPLRTPGSNIRNTATADFTAQMTRLFDLHLGYGNSIYSYQQDAGDVFNYPYTRQPSYSALLDRMDQTADIDLRWKARPTTTGVLGYQYEHLDYTSPEDIIFGAAPNYVDGPGSFRSSSRNSDAHFAYVGADEAFTPKLNGSLRVGAEYVDYYNAHTSATSPYVDASLSYQYMQDSTAQFGIKHIHNSTDVAGIVGSTPVLDEESTSVYLSVSHRVTSRFTASALAQAQYSTFNGGGTYDGKGEDFYVFNLNLAYHFTPWLTGETGYVYNKLNTDIADRAYTRNEVYLGVRATY